MWCRWPPGVGVCWRVRHGTCSIGVAHAVWHMLGVVRMLDACCELHQPSTRALRQICSAPRKHEGKDESEAVEEPQRQEEEEGQQEEAQQEEQDAPEVQGSAGSAVETPASKPLKYSAAEV